jgi:hypothetical protein
MWPMGIGIEKALGVADGYRNAEKENFRIN